MVTVRYFIFPKSEIGPEIKLKSKSRMKALSKPNGVYTRVDIESVDSFKVKKAALGKELDASDDEPILDLIKTFYPCASFTHNGIEYSVVKGIVPKEAIEAFSKFSGKDALSAESLIALGLEDVIVAKDDNGLFDYVLAKFGIDLSGDRQVGLDEEGKPIMAPYLIKCIMAGE